MMIHNHLLDSSDFNHAINVLFLEKETKDVFYKAAEELNELATKLLQFANKEQSFEDVVAVSYLAEELVDVQMHVLLLQSYMPKDLVGYLSREKIKKMLDSKDYKKYLSIYNEKRASDK